MCLIIVSENGMRDVPRDVIADSMRMNRDGFGVVWHDELLSEVSCRRTLDPAAHLADLDCIPESAPVVIHHRFATHGVRDVANCHPFAIPTKAGRCYLAHNGITPTPRRLPKGWSDTRWFALSIIGPAIRHEGISSAVAVAELCETLDPCSRYAAMDSRGRIAIGNEGDGEWIGGVWYSTPGWGWDNDSDWDTERDWLDGYGRALSALDRMPRQSIIIPAVEPRKAKPGNLTPVTRRNRKR